MPKKGLVKNKEKKWKQKFIKIWQYNEMLESTMQKGESIEDYVGP
jgi:hypothetical protein